ncbi:MAG: hypothetical protein GY852_05960 [bacterium]|nr:hypothetical protein [bacterium]
MKTYYFDASGLDTTSPTRNHTIKEALLLFARICGFETTCREGGIWITGEESRIDFAMVKFSFQMSFIA